MGKAIFDSEKGCYVITNEGRAHIAAPKVLSASLLEDKSVSSGVRSKAPTSSEPAPHSVEYFENAAMQSLSFERAHAEDNILFEKLCSICKAAPIPANTTFVPAISRSDNGHWMFIHNETLKFISHKEM
jgi:hypothetical protein